MRNSHFIQVYDVLRLDDEESLNAVVRVACPSFPGDKMESEVSFNAKFFQNVVDDVLCAGGHLAVSCNAYLYSSSRSVCLEFEWIKYNRSGIYDTPESTLAYCVVVSI